MSWCGLPTQNRDRKASQGRDETGFERSGPEAEIAKWTCLVSADALSMHRAQNV